MSPVQLSVFAVVCILAAALTITDPDLNRSGWPALLVGASIILIVVLAVTLLLRFRRHQLSKVWVGVLVVLVVLEAVAVGGLSAFAASATATDVSLVQDYYTQLDADIGLANALSDGVPLTSDITYKSLRTQATKTGDRLKALAYSGRLGDYAAAVWSWSLDIEFAMILAKPGTHIHVAPTPRPFAIAMSNDEVDAAVAASIQKVTVLSQYGDRQANLAPTLKGNIFADVAVVYLGARMDAQAYWLRGVYSSSDANWVADHAAFVDGLASPHSDITSWPAPRNFAPCHAQNCGATLPWTKAITGLRAQIERAPITPTSRLEVAATHVVLPKGTKLVLGVLETPPPVHFDPALGPQTVTLSVDEPAGSTILQVETFTPNHLWPPCTPVTDVPVQHWSPWQELIYYAFLCGFVSGGTNITGGPTISGAAPGPSSLTAFLKACKGSGGVDDPGLAQLPGSRLPTAEDGWSCEQPDGNRCWSLLTFSGIVYKGGDAGCPEVGLVPKPGGPIFGPVAQLLGPIVQSLIPTPNPSNGQPTNNPSHGGGDPTYYLHFNCGGDPTCIQTPGNGSNTGIFQDFSSTGDNRRACNDGRIPFDNLGEAQSSWCSTSNDPRDTGP